MHYEHATSTYVDVLQIFVIITSVIHRTTCSNMYQVGVTEILVITNKSSLDCIIKVISGSSLDTTIRVFQLTLQFNQSHFTIYSFENKWKSIKSLKLVWDLIAPT